jgi:dTDP-4-dehydrorhamnose 3,5-epimerase
MRVRETELSGVLMIEPDVWADDRGCFLETWNESRYRVLGIERAFVQDNVSVSRRGVIRGLHYQDPNPQGKLVSVLHGAAFDVAVDVRPGSPTFGEWTGVEISAANRWQLWIPPGLAHGFQALEDGTVFCYKCDELYSPADERCLRWDDPAIGIEWPLADGIVSPRDAAAPFLNPITTDELSYTN